MPDLSKSPRWARVELGKRDARFFFRRHFAHYMTRDMREMQWSMLDHSNNLCVGTKQRIAIEASRGHGKSVILNTNTVTRAACYGFHRYIVLLGTPGNDGVEGHLANIVEELENSETLRDDFGESILPAYDNKGQAKKWDDRHVILRNGVKISAITKKKGVRGLRHGSHRPSLFIIDDVQKDEDVMSYERRVADQKWLTEQVIGALPPGGAGNICIVDTVKHEDCLVRWQGKNKHWTHESWPAYDDNGNGRFFTNEELETIREEIGETAFAKEFLLSPRDPSNQIFNWDEFDKFDPETVTDDESGIHVNGDKLSHVIVAHDPIPLLEDSRDRRKSDVRKGDYSSTVVAGIGTDKRKFGSTDRARKYVLEDYTRRVSIEESIRRVVSMAERWNANEIIVESNNFQGLVGRDLREALSAASISVPVRYERVTQNKMTRVFAMEPIISRGEAVFSLALSDQYKSQWTDLRRDDSHAHDDAPDATEKALRALCKRDIRSGARFGPRIRRVAA